MEVNAPDYSWQSCFALGWLNIRTVVRGCTARSTVGCVLRCGLVFQACAGLGVVICYNLCVGYGRNNREKIPMFVGVSLPSNNIDT